MDIAETIKSRRQALRLTQQALADKIGVGQSAVQQWESGMSAPRRRHLPSVAEALGMTVAELMGAPTAENTNALEGPPIAGAVPLISWVQAGTWNETVDNHAPHDAETWLYATRQVSPRAFALRVRGDSMEAPHGRPTYPDGSIIIVDPDRSVYNGARVVVRLEGQQESTFKVFVEDSGRRYLKPLNPRYPIIEVSSEATVCGVVVQTIMLED